MPSWISALLLDLLSLALLAALGVLAIRFLAPKANRFETAAVGLPIGIGLLTYVVFLSSWAGVEIRLETLTGIYVGLAILLIAGLRLQSAVRPRPLEETTSAEPPTGSRLADSAVWVILGVAALASVAISVGRSHTPFDASAIWAAKGYGIAKVGTIFAGRDWGAHGLGYPLNIPILISFFQLVDGDLIPGSKLVFPLFYLSMLLGAVGFWRRLRLGNLWVMIGSLLLATVPEVFRHATYGYVNIPASAYLTLGTMWGILGMARESKGYSLVGGLLLGFASWTRVEGSLYALVIVAAIAGAWLMTRPGRLHVVWLVAPVAVLGGTWLFFGQANGLSNDMAGGAIPAAIRGWSRGDLHLHSIRLIFGYTRRELLETHTWGLLFPLAMAALILYARRLVDRRVPEILALGLATLGASLATASLFYVGSYIRSDLVAWMTRGFPRAFFPAAILLGILVFALAGTPPFSGANASTVPGERVKA
jgi:hypothetical protein